MQMGKEWRASNGPPVDINSEGVRAWRLQYGSPCELIGKRDDNPSRTVRFYATGHEQADDVLLGREGVRSHEEHGRKAQGLCRDHSIVVGRVAWGPLTTCTVPSGARDGEGVVTCRWYNIETVKKGYSNQYNLDFVCIHRKIHIFCSSNHSSLKNNRVSIVSWMQRTERSAGSPTVWCARTGSSPPSWRGS